MHQLLVLTVDPDQTAIESTIVIRRADGSSQTFYNWGQSLSFPHKSRLQDNDLQRR